MFAGEREKSASFVGRRSRSPAGEMVNFAMAKGQRCHELMLVDLAVSSHLAQNGFVPLGRGAYVQQQAAKRPSTPKSGAEIAMGMTVAVERLEAGLFLSMDLKAKLTIQEGPRGGATQCRCGGGRGARRLRGYGASTRAYEPT